MFQIALHNDVFSVLYQSLIEIIAGLWLVIHFEQFVISSAEINKHLDVELKKNATGMESFDDLWCFQIEQWQRIRVQNQPEKTRLQAEVRG